MIVQEVILPKRRKFMYYQALRIFLLRDNKTLQFTHEKAYEIGK